jgi:drug/metabolite transporter superfamily protein YnfA
VQQQHERWRDNDRHQSPDPVLVRSLVLFVLAAYGGVFVAGSLAWGMVMDGFRPDRYDVIGSLVCLAGVAVIMYAPRPA